MEPTGRLEGESDLAEQDGLPGEAKDTIDRTPRRAYLDDRWGSTMPIAADEDGGGGPATAPIGQEPPADHGLFAPRGAHARAHGGGDQGVRGPWENAQRQGTIARIVMVIAGKLLLPMRGSLGVVESVDKGGGRRGGTRDAVVHQGPREPLEGLAV